ncbi:hypothetical protein LDY98_18380, partial [Pseudomonas aeruginosa]|nr:hypothetical protein [Pseudomonas aeruginosa]
MVGRLAGDELAGVAFQLLARLEPLLPAVREAVDWERSLAARWHRDGRSGYLQPLEVSL